MKKLLDIATRHVSGEEAVGAAFVLGDTAAAADGGRTAPTMATAKGARKGAKGGKKGQKWRPRCIAAVASNGGSDEGVDDFSEEYVVAVERNFKWQTRLPKDHFKILLEATCPHNSYPIKHKLKDCTLMKMFMMSGAFSKDRKPEEDLGGKSAAPIPLEAAVMTIFDRPHRGPRNAMWLVEPWIPDLLR
jgi:hypothetical protein